MRGHYLKPNHKTECIHEAIWFDTETDQITLTDDDIGHTLKQGMASYSRWRKGTGWSPPQWYRFESATAFWDWVEARTRPKTKLYIFCHNSNFDYPVVDAFTQLPSRGWEPGKIIAEGPPTMIELKKPDRSLLLLDTLNWWRVPLKALGKSLGLPKLDMPDNGAAQEAWDTYNKRDVEIIMAAVQRWSDFLRDNDLGGFAPTLAGQAMRSYRHRFMRHRILIDDNKHALACSREAYHGGRTEAWYIGEAKGNFHLVDVRSMYPYVMRDHCYPTKLAWYTRCTDARDLARMLRKYLVCARIRVRTSIPALPVVLGGKLVYPVGEFDCALSTPQLTWALENADVLAVHDMAMYESAPLFESFITELYAARLEARAAGDEVQAYLLKILMNSLYGKWGQRGMFFEEVYRVKDMNPQSWVEVDADTGERTKFRQLMGVVMSESKRSESSGSHPAIAAHVTANASMYLWRLAEAAGLCHVYYMDTDSLLVDDAGLRNLSPYMGDGALGTLQLEGTFEDIEIHGAKDYRFGTRKKVKGVRSTAEWLDPNTVRQEKWVGLRGMIRNGDCTMPVTRTMIKHLTRRYDKGLVGADGRVTPLVLGPEAGGSAAGIEF